MNFLRTPLIKRNRDMLIFHAATGAVFLFFLIQIHEVYKRFYAPKAFDTPLLYVAFVLAACVIYSVMYVTYIIREGRKEWASGKAFS